MTALLLCCLGQLVSFERPGYATVTGTPDSVLQFYDRWHNEIDSSCSERDYIADEINRTGQCMFAIDDKLAETIVLHGYTARLGWIYYNSIWHAGLEVAGLSAVVWWVRRRKRVLEGATIE